MSVMKRSHRVGYLTSIVTCLTIILIFSILNSPVYVSAATTATISGRVVDEYNQGMESVGVSVYLSSGSYVKTEYTSSEGYIDIDLDVGKSYVLYFSREGYAKVTKSISSLTGDFDLGDITLLKGLRLSSSGLGRVANPGDKLTISFTVSNIGEGAEEVTFNVVIVNLYSAGWSTRILDTTGEVTRVYLLSGASINLQLEVTIPSTAIGNSGLLLTAVGKTSSTLNFMIVTKQVGEQITLTAKFPDITVEAGKAMQYSITITNTGQVDRLLALSAGAPANWNVVFKSGTLGVSMLYLAAGKSESLVIEVTTPSTVSIGAYTIPVQIKSEDGAISIEKVLKATIIGSYALSLAPSTLLTSVTTGGSTTFTAKITNTGYSSVTGVGLSIDVPSGWESSITPLRAESLKPGESSTFTVVVKTTGTTVAGDYYITLTGSSDQVKSDIVQVRVTATASTSWGLIGVGIAVVMVIALLLVFRRFRRR